MFVAVLSLQQWLILTGLYVEVKPFPYLWFLLYLFRNVYQDLKVISIYSKKISIEYVLKWNMSFDLWSVKSFRLQKFLQGHKIETSDEKITKGILCVILTQYKKQIRHKIPQSVVGCWYCDIEYRKHTKDRTFNDSCGNNNLLMKTNLKTKRTNTFACIQTFFLLKIDVSQSFDT